MGFFNLVETFFFISLAITFVLIMMLVYHFKDRLTSLESKSETILEIVNNLLKENSVLKSGYLQIIQSIQTSRHIEQSNTRIVVSEDEDNDSDDDETVQDDDDDDAEQDYDNDDQEFESDISYQEPVIKQIQIHGGFTTEINYIADINEVDFEKISNEMDCLEVDIQEENDYLEIGVEEIVVTKLDDINQEEDNDNTEVILENTSIQPMEVYRKMELGELRSLVIQKGYATDTKKMKKMDLIRLLIPSSTN